MSVILNFRRAMDIITQGQEGNPVWIPPPYSRIADNFGIGPGMYHYVGGEPGTGKSAFVHQTYVLYPYQWVMNNPDKEIDIHILLWSMERPPEMVMMKWACSYIYRKFGMLVSPFQLAGYSPSRIPSDVLMAIRNAEGFFEQMSDKVELHYKATPKEIVGRVVRYMEANGRYEIIPPLEGEPERRIYHPNNPRKLVIVVADHMGLLKPDLHEPRQQRIEKLSDEFQYLRDVYRCTPVGISQFNRGIRSLDRRRMAELRPEATDFKDSAKPYEDADIAFGLFEPSNFGVEEYLGYNITQFFSQIAGNRFRSSTLLKNSYGSKDLHLPLHFIGENGMFRQMPPSEDFIANPNLYRLYANVDPSIRNIRAR